MAMGSLSSERSNSNMENTTQWTVRLGAETMMKMKIFGNTRETGGEINWETGTDIHTILYKGLHQQ